MNYDKNGNKNNHNFTMLSEHNWVAECTYIQRIKCSHILKLFNGVKIVKNMLRSIGFIGLYVEPCIMLAPIKCKLPILSQACVYFKDASNNVITWRLRQRGNGCNTFFSDSCPLIRPPATRVCPGSAQAHGSLGYNSN